MKDKKVNLFGLIGLGCLLIVVIIGIFSFLIENKDIILIIRIIQIPLNIIAVVF